MRLLVAEPESCQVLTSTADIHRWVQTLQLNHLTEWLIDIDLVDGKEVHVFERTDDL